MDTNELEHSKWFESLGAIEKGTYDEIGTSGLPSDYFNHWLGFSFIRENNLNLLKSTVENIV